MDIGALRHRVTLQRKGITRNDYGAEVEGWVDWVTVWASVEPLRGREYFSAQQVNAEVTTRIRIRYRAGIRPEMRVVYGDRIYDILSVIDPEERHREIQLMAREVT